MLAHYGVVPLLIGFGAAWLSAVIAVKWMVAYLKSHGLEIFGWYRIGAAIVVASWLLWPVMFK
jgi:undecaprenyl-diphosphatase